MFLFNSHSSMDIFTDDFKVNKKRKLQHDLENSPLPFPKHKFSDQFRSCGPSGTKETNDACNWINAAAAKEPMDYGSEEPGESHHDSNSVGEGYDTSHTTMTLDLDEAEESFERMDSPSVSSYLKNNINQNDNLDSFAIQHIEDVEQLDHDAENEDLLIYSNDVAPHAFVVSSRRLIDGNDARSKTKKPTIDKEFEQYFSMLML
ncbi:hypothetical protein ZIOFF_006797 [Zingiber officinale]|uniref:Uncharacterized protein n=1 Tax=Zingiber officinale TaxID=94328 RepID=A0A8J5HW25_ZINOF|nr:hypothetical protein ZIOFF_006797 [Zingiber officinale]